MTLGDPFGLGLRGGVRWGGQRKKCVFFTSFRKAKFCVFLQFWYDFRSSLEGKIDDTFDCGDLFSDVFFLLVFLSSFYHFSKAANLDFIAPVEAKHYFLRNRRFRKRVKKSMKLGAFLEPKSSKIDKKGCSKLRHFFMSFFLAFFAFFADFGSICYNSTRPKIAKNH